MAFALKLFKAYIEARFKIINGAGKITLLRSTLDGSKENTAASGTAFAFYAKAHPA